MSKVFSPSSKLEAEPEYQNEKEALQKLDALLISPKQNILVSQIIGKTQRDKIQNNT